MSKSIEELQDEIDELKQERDELQQTIDDHNDELSNREEEGYDRAMLEMENKIEHAFKSGFECGIYTDTNTGILKSFLNYKMEQRL